MFENIRLGLRNLFRRQETERELNAELLEYLERSVEQKMQVGMLREEAMRAARAEFGSVEAVKDSVRDAGWESLIDSVRGDLLFAVRMMRRSPGFTAVIVATLALGIGANTALFTVINAVLLKPLPVSNPNQLALMVWDSENPGHPLASGYDGSSSDEFSTTGHDQGTSFPYITYERMAQAKDTFSDVFAFAAIEQLNVIVDGSAEVAPGQYVSGDYYNGLGVAAWRGRLLNEEDETDGAPPAAVITWRYWQRRFNGDEEALGKTVLVNNEKFTIVGVSPPGFNGALELGQSVDVTLPVTSDRRIEAANANTEKPGLWWLHIMARLQPGVSREQAQARMDSVFQQSAIDGLSAAIAAGQARPRTIEARDYPHLQLSPGGAGRRVLTASIPPSAHTADGSGGAGAADRLHQRRQPVAGPRYGAPAGTWDARCSRREAPEADAPVVYRIPFVIRNCRRCRHRPGRMGEGSIARVVAVDPEGFHECRTGCRPGRACVGFRLRRFSADGIAVWRCSGPARRHEPIAPNR
jgi:hypothetical protein